MSPINSTRATFDRKFRLVLRKWRILSGEIRLRPLKERRVNIERISRARDAEIRIDLRSATRGRDESRRVAPA